ncbi:MAG TPA: flagellar hook-basal body complex protein FliE [Acidilobales archaeon]|nr:flagellar hook-basal body complex protein FliE [Acidilobales archaeon]
MRGSKHENILLCVTGMPGAGKSLVARIISKEFNLRIISMGDVVREEAKRRGIPQDMSSMMKFAEELRIKYGDDIVAKLTLDYIRRKGYEGILVIDGVRSLSEIKTFNNYGKVLIIAVHASPKVRFKRLKSRGRRDDPKVWSEFASRDMKELRFGIGNVIALADVMIVNEGKDLDRLKDEVVSKIREVLKDVYVKS